MKESAYSRLLAELELLRLHWADSLGYLAQHVMYLTKQSQANDRSLLQYQTQLNNWLKQVEEEQREYRDEIQQAVTDMADMTRAWEAHWRRVYKDKAKKPRR